MAIVESTGVQLAKRPEHRSHMRVAYTPSPFGQLLYYALTGRGIEDWMRTERELRVFSTIWKVLLFVLILIVKEWLFERVVDSVSGRRSPFN
jgi:hypothetical protein